MCVAEVRVPVSWASEGGEVVEDHVHCEHCREIDSFGVLVVGC